MSEEICQLTIINNKHAKISLADQTLFNRLRRTLSYKTAGVEYTAAFKNGWDGINYLLSKNGTFLLGLLNKVINFLNINKIEYQLIDNRNKLLKNESIDLSINLNKYGFAPRSYQQRIVDAAIANTKGIVRACTGAGKT